MTEEILGPWGLAALLFGTFAYVRWGGAKPERDTMALLVMLWAATWFIFLVTGGHFLPAYAALDFLAGGSLFVFRQKRWQYIVVYLFGAMMLLHAITYFNISIEGSGDIAYARCLNILFALQIATVLTIRWQAGHEGRWLDRIPGWRPARAWLLDHSEFGRKNATGTGS
jgi:hypothetical protein